MFELRGLLLVREARSSRLNESPRSCSVVEKDQLMLKVGSQVTVKTFHAVKAVVLRYAFPVRYTQHPRLLMILSDLCAGYAQIWERVPCPYPCRVGHSDSSLELESAGTLSSRVRASPVLSDFHSDRLSHRIRRISPSPAGIIIRAAQ